MKRLAIAATLFAFAGFAQQPSLSSAPVTKTAQAADAPPGQYIGVGSCLNSGCHGSTEPLRATPVLQNEFYTWLNRDRHAGAYNILLSASSARILRNMRLRGQAWEAKLCLDCHTMNVPASAVHAPPSADAMTSTTVNPEDGIQCEACHGPASGWRAGHTEEGWTHEQSVAHGMTDLRSPRNRGMVCAGCHVGNATKEVDHELIASGHPVLAFELDNYTASMPPHWSPENRSGRDAHGVRAWSVGQLIKFRQSLDNLARHARGDEWPEFSDMSCTNCHHDLGRSSARQERGWPDRAGLPSWSPQHWGVLRLLVARLSPQAREEIDPLVRQLARGVSRMNDPAGVAATAERARQLVDALMPKADALRWSESDVRSMMRSIASDEEFLRDADLYAAEQAALSLQSLASDLTRRNPRLLRSPMMRSIDALFEELQHREDYDAGRFVEKIRAVKAAL